MVSFDDILLDSVENVKPHGGSEEFGTPPNFGVHVRLAHRCVTKVLDDVMGSHCDGE